ncbi:MAG: Alpha-xylosidase [Firmicutes bacterium ADurb.Bin146]|nr:MAG: Alpha-xylosidase [Firmicutes bacterium ADurb.Bin146]
MKTFKYKNGYICLTALSENAVRIRTGLSDKFPEENPCVRYGIYDMSDKGDICNIPVTIDDDRLIINNMRTEIVFGKGFDLKMTVTPSERFYGLGDADRSTLEKRGTEHVIWVQNVKCYIPYPMIVSSNGWGIFSSTTFRQKFDICCTDSDILSIYSDKGKCDIVVFTGDNYKDLLTQFKSITGFSKLLPKFAYGLSYVANQKIDAFNMINEMYTFRREEIPCDVYGLEPEWMEKRYDSSVDKKFNTTKFYIPYWMNTETIKNNTFFKPIRDMDFKLSLWLCCNYDLSYEEERNAVIKKQKEQQNDDSSDLSYLEDRFEIDEHLGNPKYMDTLTVREEPWFKHLEKFVDMGAKAFKLDGAWQVEEHPDRLYGNGMKDDEMHNLYPLIYAKQMSDGYEKHTGTRSLVYSSGGFAGIQQYVATWSGDTGGGPKPLVSMLNLAMSGHVNTTCDMSVHSIEGIHFGFLQPWSQQCNWDYWNQPWLFTKEFKKAYIYYARLRYSLIPYIYSAAFEAYANITPIMRPLVYDYPEDEKTFNILNQYMFGRFLMVAAFIGENKVYLPEGIWIDMFTNKEYEGERYISYDIPQGKGGALFIKKGAILPRSYGLLSVSEKPFNSYTIEIYPSVLEHTFKLYEDDGISLEYKEGKRSITEFKVIKVDNAIKISVSERKGDYSNKPDMVSYDLKVMNINENDLIYINEVLNQHEIIDGIGVIHINEKELFG